LFALARPKLEPGGVVVADNVLSHEETLGAYSHARQTDPTLESVTLPLDRGLEVSVVLTQSLK
jgi:predicted O-methyltransferase YrrM